MKTAKITKIKIALLAAAAFLPSMAFAASTDLKGLAGSITGILSLLIPTLFGVALVAFFWGLVRYLSAVGGDENAISDGKKIMIYGAIGLAVMASVYGIVDIVGQTFFGTSILNSTTQQLNVGSYTTPDQSGNCPAGQQIQENDDGTETCVTN